jgi:hypothetical protein
MAAPHGSLRLPYSELNRDRPHVPELTCTPAMAEPVPRSDFRHMSAAGESIPVFRRLAASLMLWVGVLALASPVLACGAVSTPVRDCCPEGAPSPCDNGGGSQGIAACCAAAPIASSAAAIESSRSQHERSPDSESPDPLILSAWFDTFVAPTAPEPLLYLLAGPPPGRDATLTWLHTGRLRL